MSEKLELVEVSEAAAKAQRKRNIAIGIALALLVIVFYGATLVKLGSNPPKIPGSVVVDQ